MWEASPSEQAVTPVFWWLRWEVSFNIKEGIEDLMCLFVVDLKVKVRLGFIATRPGTRDLIISIECYCM